MKLERGESLTLYGSTHSMTTKIKPFAHLKSVNPSGFPSPLVT